MRFDSRSLFFASAAVEMAWFMMFLSLYVLPWTPYESLFGALVYMVITPAIMPVGIVSLAFFVAGIAVWLREEINN